MNSGPSTHVLGCGLGQLPLLLLLPPLLLLSSSLGGLALPVHPSRQISRPSRVHDLRPRSRRALNEMADDTPEQVLEIERDRLWREGRSKGTAGTGAEDEGADAAHPTSVNRPPRFRKGKRWKEQLLHSLAAFPLLNQSNPTVLKFASVVAHSLLPWREVEGVKRGMGAGHGMVSREILKKMATSPEFMFACGHVRIVRGRIFFRLGGFLRDWFATRRFVHTLKTIERAIEEYGLHSLTAELFLNNFDQPLSLDSSPAELRGGYPVFSTQSWPNSVDIPYPDPLDLEETYMSKHSDKTPWRSRKSQAVFRGSSTSYYIFNSTNWRANPRFRLHRMSEARPDLLDARLIRWSKLVGPNTQQRLEEDGLALGEPMTRAELDQFKYEVVVDGGGGTSRTCGVLSSQRVLIKQESMYSQFLQPLLEPYVHYIPTGHHFHDLYDQVEWLQHHDSLALATSRRANKAASQLCTWKGRVLYWAVLLVKYSAEAMEDSSGVQVPGDICHHRMSEKNIRKWQTVEDRLAQVPEGWPYRCEQYRDKPQPPCTVFCTWGSLTDLPMRWLAMDSLKHIEVHDI